MHSLESQYRQRLPASEQAPSQFAAPIAGGVTHDSWQISPYAPVFSHAQGARKWDVDGNEYIDFWMGHGALILGHGHPAVVDAVLRQVNQGLHFGGSARVVLEWAHQIKSMVPGVKKLRFCASGSEATTLALRVARAYTGRQLCIRLDGHFHGWHDEALAHLQEPGVSGISAHVMDQVLIGSPLDIESIQVQLEMEDVAAVILEPGGGSGGSLPFDLDLLLQLRRLTTANGALLIFDEVMSGFRYAPGGAQEIADVSPDLTVLAKILCGGLPGAAVAGSDRVMSVFGCGISRPHGHARVCHTGTFNGYTLAAAAGLATLTAIEDGLVQRNISRLCKNLVSNINAEAERRDLDIRAFENHSIFHFMVGAIKEDFSLEPGPGALLLQRKHQQEYQMLRKALLLEGIDCHHSHGWLSTAHDDETIEIAIEWISRALDRLRGHKEFYLHAA